MVLNKSCSMASDPVSTGGGSMSPVDGGESGSESPGLAVVLVAWLLVSVPLIWGVWQTIKKASALFR
jgi:hypothetical protein